MNEGGAEQGNLRVNSGAIHGDALPQSKGSLAVIKGLASYRRQLKSRAAGHDWWQKPIPIQGRVADNVPRLARDLVQDWIETKSAQHCILLGEPGAGKTGLLVWAASSVGASEQSIALWVSAKQLQNLTTIDLTEILSICEPRAPVDTVDEFEGYEIILLLDGLDELVGATENGETRAGLLLKQTLDCLPEKWRILASCRAPVFEVLRATIMESLPRAARLATASDLHDAAISRALGIEGASAIMIEVSRVDTLAAIEYLEESVLPKATLERLFADDRWRQLLTSPFLLRLARMGLPALFEYGAPPLDRLYLSYVRASLFREKSDLIEPEVSEILNDLTRFSNFIGRKHRLRKPELPLRADLVRSTAGGHDFAHYSLWEFFFARHLFSEISKLSAETLARVDLIAGYNVNRLLIPMILRQFPPAELGQPPSSLRLVAPNEYLQFLAHTKWRRTVGYGIHPARSLNAPVSTFRFNYDEALAIHGDRLHGTGNSCVATAISWYDAAAFCFHKKVRLPTRRELVSLRPEGNRLLWSCQWFDESLSHIAVYDMNSGEVYGLNPDVRLPRNALAVVGG